MFDKLGDAFHYAIKLYIDSGLTCHYMLVQLANRIEVVPDNGVHDIKYMFSTRDFADANH